MINTNQILNLNKKLDDIEKSINDLNYINSTGDLIPRNLDVSGTFISQFGRFTSSGDVFFLNKELYDNTYIVTNDTEYDNTGLFIKLSNIGDKESELCFVNNSTGYSEINSAGRTIYSDSNNYLGIPLDDFYIINNESVNIIGKTGELFILNEFRIDNIKYEDFEFFSQVGNENSILDSFSTQDVYIKEYNLFIYSTTISQSLNIVISAAGQGESGIFIKRGPNLFEGIDINEEITFDCVLQDDNVLLTINNKLEDLEARRIFIKGISKAYLK
jgi:hypothetical protein